MIRRCAAVFVIAVLAGTALAGISGPLPDSQSTGLSSSVTFVAAPFTAFQTDGWSLDNSQIEKQARLLMATGVSASFVCGTTGEGVSMTVAERQSVAEEWVRVARRLEEELGSKLEIIVHVGSNSLEEARTLAAHASKIGADAIGTITPMYFKPATVRDLVRTVKSIGDAAPSLPLYYYHIPSFTGVNFKMYDFLTEADGVIPNLKGIKYTDYDLFDYGRCLRFKDGKYTVMYGRDEQMAGALAIGGRYFVGSTYNYYNTLYLGLVDAFMSGDSAEVARRQGMAQDFLSIMAAYGSGAQKGLLKWLGLDLGPMRLPQDTMTDEDTVKEMVGKLKSAGLLPKLPSSEPLAVRSESSRPNRLRSSSSIVEAESDTVRVYTNGEDGYAVYRIPSMIRHPKDGTLLAFAEGRKFGSGDHGWVDIVLKRSSDNGKTWGNMSVVMSQSTDAEQTTCGNPSPVIDEATGLVTLVYSVNNTNVQAMWSSDMGSTWSRERDITSDVKDPSWSWYATGPPGGVQMSNGRLVIACDHSVTKTKRMESHVIYSDDGGRSWARGGTVPCDGCNEAQVATHGGDLVINMRNQHPTKDQGAHTRVVSSSTDGGLTWAKGAVVTALESPVCQGSFAAFTTSTGEHAFVASNPTGTKRERMTVRVTADGGQTWSDVSELWAGPAAYSSLAVMPDARAAACLYERGSKGPYEGLYLDIVPLP